MKTLIKLIIILALLLFILSILFRNEILNYVAKRNELKSNELMFIAGRPYAIFNIGGKNDIALVDTGATQSKIDLGKFNPALIAPHGNINVNTPLGRTNASIYKVVDMNFMTRHISNLTVSKTKKMQSNTIGSPEIFSAQEVLITKNGIYYDKHIEEFKNAFEVPVTYTRSDDKLPKIRSVIYHLEINGEIQQAILDTGIKSLLTGTTLNSHNKTLPFFSVFRASSGLAIKKVYHQTATLKVGPDILNVDYKSIPGWNAPRAKYYLGAEILQHYSLFFNFNKNKFYFIKNEIKKI